MGTRRRRRGKKGHIFLFLFVGCLWGSWKCRMAVFMAKYTRRQIRNPKMFLCWLVAEVRVQISNWKLYCRYILCCNRRLFFSPYTCHCLKEWSLYLMPLLIWWLGYNALYLLLKCFFPCQHLLWVNLVFGTTLIDCKTAYICRTICFAVVYFCTDVVGLPQPPNHSMS